MRIVAIVLSIIAILWLADAGGRLLLRGETRFDHRSSTDPGTRTLFVYFPGVLADGVTSSEDLREVWLQHGDVLMVSYDGNRFDGHEVARAAATWLEQYAADNYDDVVFIGSSMGGMLSYLTIQLSQRKLPGVEISFVPIDAPPARQYLQSPLDKAALGSWLWWAGPLSNLFSRLWFNATFVSPNDENIEEGVDRERLAQRVEQAKGYALSWSMDQNRFISGFRGVMPGSLDGIHVVYVRSMRDNDTTRPEAFNPWFHASGGTAVRVFVDSPHVGYAERPTTWRLAWEHRIIPALHLD
jgi:pimeloyl-ACP methyl ester carboxylesterase